MAVVPENPEALKNAAGPSVIQDIWLGKVGKPELERQAAGATAATHGAHGLAEHGAASSSPQVDPRMTSTAGHTAAGTVSMRGKSVAAGGEASWPPNNPDYDPEAPARFVSKVALLDAIAEQYGLDFMELVEVSLPPLDELLGCVYSGFGADARHLLRPRAQRRGSRGGPNSRASASAESVGVWSNRAVNSRAGPFVPSWRGHGGRPVIEEPHSVRARLRQEALSCNRSFRYNS